jgi:DNA-binding transcriptional LysR family regulator
MGLEEIGTFIEAVDRGSLTAAGNALGVPKSTVGRRIARLEAELGQELLRRTSRTFALTAAGEALYQRAAPAVRDLTEAARFAREDDAALVGELKVTVTVDLGSSLPFVRLCARFHELHPGVRLTVDLSDRMVDLVAEGVDVAFRVHGGPLPDRALLRARRVGPFRFAMYASPAYLARRDAPEHPGALVNHACIGMSFFDQGWPLAHAGGPAEIFPIGPGLRGSGTGFHPTAVTVGAGIGLLPACIGEELVASGLAERVLPGWESPAATLSLVWPVSRVSSRRLRAFLDHVLAGGLLPP